MKFGIFLITAFIFLGSPFFTYAQLDTFQISTVAQILQLFGADRETILTVDRILRGTNSRSSTFGTSPPRKELLFTEGLSEIPSACSNGFSRSLTFGDTGEDVRTLQIFLNTHGVQLAKEGPGSVGKETDYFGPRTHRALVVWQRNNDVAPASGFFGPLTRATLSKTCSIATFATPISTTTPSEFATSTDTSTFATNTTTTEETTTTTATVIIGGGGGGGGGASAPPPNSAPTITLLGSTEISISTGSSYTDPGVSANDPEDGDLSGAITVSGEVDYLTPGTYTLTYNVTDSDGAAGEASRIVTVTPPAPLSQEEQEPTYTLAPAGQNASIKISSSKTADPKFVNVQINPLHVYVGDTQTLSATVESASPIVSVKAVTQLDNQALTLELEETSPGSGTYATSWTVFDTHVRIYHTTFVAENEAGQTNSITLAWSDPCSGITQGTDSSLSADCTVSAVDGVDMGNLTIPSGKTLTLNSGATWVWNPGKTVTIDGTIAINGTATMKKGYLFYSGSTNDDANTTSKVYDANSTKSGYVRVGTHFSFSGSDQTGASLDTYYASNTETITGISNGTAVSLSGSSSYKRMSINGGSWVTSGTINNGETLRLRQKSSSSNSTETTITATIAGKSSTFSVITEMEDIPPPCNPDCW